MKTMILPFSEPSVSLESVGGKGLSLARMFQAGLPVPGGFLITTSAYRAFVDANHLQELILQAVTAVDPTDTAALEAAAEKIAALFAEGRLPVEIVKEIEKSYHPFQAKPVAVRSSATAEDLPGASFAGQQETYLNISGLEALLEAVRRCWASLWTARAISYRMKNAIDPETVALAVVVQELVFADAAGVLFTANPVNGQRAQMLINAAWGLGEAIVSGAVTPDTLTIEKATGRVVDRQTAEKTIMTVRTESGTAEVPVPAAKRKQPVLNASQAAELSALGARIETFYGSPMDIEWTLAEGKFAIVQARPITALPVDWVLPDAGAIYSRGSLAEHIPGPVTPLFATLGLRIANEETAKMWQVVLGKNYQRLMGGSGFYQPLNGYVYGGVKMDVRSMLVMTWKSFTQVLPTFRNSVARWQVARHELLEVVSAREQFDPAGMQPSELLEGACEVYRAACLYFTRIQLTLPAASTSETLLMRFYKMVKRAGDPDGSVLLLGNEAQALRAEKSLYDLAKWLQAGDPLLREYIVRTPVEELLEGLAASRPTSGISIAAWTDLRERFNRHMAEFGRTTYEFDFSNPTAGEMPAPQLEAVKAFLSGQAGDPYLRQAAAIERRDALAAALTRRLGWPFKGLFISLYHWARETSPMREDSIADLGMGHPILRRFLGELGRRLAERGALEQAADVYWLDETELKTMVTALEGNLPLPDLAGQISDRKARRAAQVKFNPPILLPQKSGFSRLIHGGEAVSKNGRTVLTGAGTSGGLVTAPARVLHGPEDFSRMRTGEVLVAVTTTPAWTPLFTLASAVVTDIGGPLSHSSIVAREFGIPAVMAARQATRLIRDGQLVTVDGGKGTVTLND
jgi:phosphohistidine swiveling domain-containing protein